MNKLFLFFFATLWVLNGKSQTIENVDFKYIDEKILIYYDLVNCIDGYKYEIDIKFADEKGNIIIPRSNMTGDFGLVTCGKNKKAVWDLFQEVDKFEGNYKVMVTIVNTLKSNGKKVVYKKIRIVETEKDGDNITVKLSNGVNNKIKTNDLFFVTSNKKIPIANDKKTLKIGKLNINETNNEFSKGLLTLNNQLNYDQVNSILKDLNLSKYHKYNIYLNILGCYPINCGIMMIGLGLGLETLSIKNNNRYGLEINILGSGYTDLNLFFVISPYVLNSKYFSLGFNIHPLTINNSSDSYTEVIKPKIGVFTGLQYSHLRFKMGLEFGKYEFSYPERNIYDKSNVSLYSSISYSLFK